MDDNLRKQYNKCLDDIQIMINSAIESLEKKDIVKTFEILKRASDRCDMENEEKRVFNGFCSGDDIWIFSPREGNIAGVYDYYDYYEDVHFCKLIAGPNKFNETVYIKNVKLIKHRDDRKKGV